MTKDLAGVEQLVRFCGGKNLSFKFHKAKKAEHPTLKKRSAAQDLGRKGLWGCITEVLLKISIPHSYW